MVDEAWQEASQSGNKTMFRNGLVIRVRIAAHLFRLIAVAAIMAGWPCSGTRAETNCVSYPAANGQAIPDLQAFISDALGTKDNPFNFAFTGNPNTCGTDPCYIYVPANSFEIREGVKVCSRSFHLDPEAIGYSGPCHFDLEVRQIWIEAAFGSVRVTRQILNRCGSRNESLSDLELTGPDHLLPNPRRKMLVVNKTELERWEMLIDLK